MCIAANATLRTAGLGEIDFERDLLAISQYARGGGITERHLLAADIIISLFQGVRLARLDMCVQIHLA
jgi:hypothetical protein